MASPKYTLRRVGATATPAQGVALANQLRPFFVGPQGLPGTPGSASGSLAPSQVTLSVSSAARAGYAEVVVANASATGASIVRASLVGEVDAENDLEELADSAMRVVGIPEVGQIRFVLTGSSAFLGQFKVLYEVFNP